MSHKASRTNKWGSMSQSRPPGPRAWSAHHHAGTLAPSGSATGKMCRSGNMAEKMEKKMEDQPLFMMSGHEERIAVSIVPS